MINLVNISKQFGTKQVLKKIDLEISNGENIVIVGANGAGKSTLLKIIIGILNPSSGELNISKKLNSTDIGFVSIESNLYEDMTVYNYLSFFGRIQNMKEKILINRIKELSSKMGLNEYLNTRISKLSTGNKQKVAFIRGIIHDPDVIILDEPTNGLDIVASSYVRKLIRAEQLAGKTTIICSHLVEDLELSNRLVVIDKGRIKRDESAENCCYKENIYNIFFETTKMGLGEVKHD